MWKNGPLTINRKWTVWNENDEGTKKEWLDWKTASQSPRRNSEGGCGSHTISITNKPSTGSPLPRANSEGTKTIRYHYPRINHGGNGRRRERIATKAKKTSCVPITFAAPQRRRRKRRRPIQTKPAYRKTTAGHTRTNEGTASHDAHAGRNRKACGCRNRGGLSAPITSK